MLLYVLLIFGSHDKWETLPLRYMPPPCVVSEDGGRYQGVQAAGTLLRVGHLRSLLVDDLVRFVSMSHLETRSSISHTDQ